MPTRRQCRRFQRELKLVEDNPCRLRHIRQKQIPSVIRNSRLGSTKILKIVRKQTLSICLAAVQRHGRELKYAKKQTLEICLRAVQSFGFALKYIQNQTPEICLAAVQNASVLEFVKEQTPEICLAAVQQDGYQLYYVKEQSPEICLAAIRQNALALEFIKRWLHFTLCQRTVYRPLSDSCSNPFGYHSTWV